MGQGAPCFFRRSRSCEAGENTRAHRSTYLADRLTPPRTLYNQPPTTLGRMLLRQGFGAQVPRTLPTAPKSSTAQQELRPPTLRYAHLALRAEGID